ncbi:MAG: uroporphyrinogen-III synthase [Microthrixaceae bacterium]
MTDRPAGDRRARTALEPLAGLVVGITADRRAEEQQELLHRLGARTVHAPTVRTLPLGADEGLRAATEAIIADPPDVVALSTGLGVRSWTEAAESMGLGDELTRVVLGATVLARGPKAAGAAVTAGWRVDWRAPNASSAEMVDHVGSLGVRGRRVAVQLDGREDPVLADAIAAHGATVVAVRVYRWLLPDDVEPVLKLIDAVCDRHVDAVTFTSSPAVWNLESIARSNGSIERLRDRLSNGVLNVCVGPICADAARSAGFDNPIQPVAARLGSMAKALAGHASASRELVQVDAAQVLMGASTIVVDGEVIELTPRERAVLGMLVRRPGTVVNKAQLLSQVWRGAADDHAVEVTVGRLRRRLDGTLRVETVPRRGYRIVGPVAG